MNLSIIRPGLGLFCLALLAPGCASHDTTNRSQLMAVKRELVLLTPEQSAWRAAAAGDQASDERRERAKNVAGLPDASAVTMSEGVKVYTLSRAVDPADPDMMHEEHVVYRREAAPVWRLQAPADQKLLLGPRVTDGRQDLRPLLDKELTAFLADQRRSVEANQKAISALFEAVEALTRQQQTLLRKEIGSKASAAEASPQNLNQEPVHEEQN